MTDNAFWLADHPVLEVLRGRRASKGKPGSRLDGHRVGLAIEGGGMRGVVSGAMLCALEDLGFKDAFDRVYSGSSGAINGAYFLVGESWYPLSIYFDDLSTKDFVDFRRFLRGETLNLKYAFDVVVDQLKPLDYGKVLASPIPLCITVTLVDELRTEVIGDFTSPADLKEALVASAWLPVAIKGTAVCRGKRAVDGGALMPHPFQAAFDDGCTHVLSLSTRPLRPPRNGRTMAQRYAARSMNKIKPGLGTCYLEAMDGYRIQRKELQQRMTEPGEAPYVLDLAPMPWMAEVKRHENDPGPIITAARGGYEVMYCALERRDPELIRQRRITAIPRLTIVVKDDV